MIVLSQTRNLPLVRKELQRAATKKQILKMLCKLPYDAKEHTKLYRVAQRRRKAAIIYFTGTTIKIATIAKRFHLSTTSIRSYLQNAIWALRREGFVYFSYDWNLD